MKKTIKIFAPATISNVGCGFDTIGFALSNPGDIITIKLRSDGRVRISKITGDRGVLPTDVNKNTSTVAILELLRNFNDNKLGVDVEIRKKMPIGSGLGSSAASAVAGVYGLNKLLNNPFNKMEVLNFAIKGESIASGAIHADNVAPSLFGGFILIRDYNPLEIVKLPVPRNLYCAVIYPHLVIETKTARKLIKKNITISAARKHFGNIGSMVSALYQGDIKLLGRSIQDEISEPVRSGLIPGYYKIKSAALNSGALGCSISGSGPSIFAFANSKKNADKIGNEMKKVVLMNGVKATLYISKINSIGPKVIK